MIQRIRADTFAQWLRHHYSKEALRHLAERGTVASFISNGDAALLFDRFADEIWLALHVEAAKGQCSDVLTFLLEQGEVERARTVNGFKQLCVRRAAKSIAGGV